MPIDPDFKLISHVDVDSGTIWIGDPCYILDKEVDLSSDLGNDWGDITDKFFERSGWFDTTRAYRRWEDDRLFAVNNHPTFKEFVEKNGYPDRKDPKYNEYVALVTQLNEEYEKKHPFTSNNDVGFASFAHGRGHEGLGTMISTNIGDGTYPVYIKYGKNGRPSQVLIDFGDESLQEASREEPVEDSSLED